MTKKQVYTLDVSRFPPFCSVLFCHYIKRNPAKNFVTVIEAFTCISKVLMRENDVTPSNVTEMKIDVSKQIKPQTDINVIPM